MVGVKSAITQELTMAIVTLRLPNVKQKTETRPRACPYCQGEIFQRWGAVHKPVKDSRYRRVKVYRYLCCRCRRTFRYYPEGVDQADQTQRLHKLAAVLWVLGISLRGTSVALAAFGVELSHMTVWRDLQEQADQLQKGRHWQAVRVLGLDGAYPLGWGKKQPVLVAVDMGTGQPVTVGRLDESNPQAVRRFLAPLVQRLGISVIVSDDLFSYRTVANQLGLEHQVCQFHVRRWVGRTLRELSQTVPKDWTWVLDEVKQLLSDLPPEGSRRLLELYKHIPERFAASGQRTPMEQLRLLLIRMSEHWESYCTFAWQKDVPWTNNRTEQAIGRMKMRARTVRGYKSWQGMQTGLLLSASGWAF